MCTLAPAPVKAEAARPLVRDLQFGPILEDADSVLPAGWSMHEEFRYYTCCEQGRALFAHPGHLCSVLGDEYDLEDGDCEPNWSYETLAVLEMLPADDICFRKLVANLFSDIGFDDRLHRLMEAKREFGRLSSMLQLARKLFCAGDFANTLKCRNKIAKVLPTCVHQGNHFYNQKRYEEALDHLRICGVLYLTAGRKFYLPAAQILERIAYSLFMLKNFRLCLRVAEHALYLYMFCEEQVDWAFMGITNVMAKCYRGMEFHGLALTHYIFCFESSRHFASLYAPDILHSAVSAYDVGTLLWMPKIDEVFHADKALSIGLCLLAMDEHERGLDFFDKAFEVYVGSKEAMISRNAFGAMAEACYAHELYEPSTRFALAAYEISKDLKSKRHQAFDLMYIAHGHAMCNRVPEAIKTFELFYSTPADSRCKENEVPNKIMFADCLQHAKQTARALETLKTVKMNTVHGEEAVWVNVVAAACFVDLGNIVQARQHLALAQGKAPQFVVTKRRVVEVLVDQLAQRLEQRALKASIELCPGLALGAPQKRGKRARAAKPARAAESLLATESPPATAAAACFVDYSNIALAALAIATEPEPECCVCMAETASAAFSPCFHLCLCTACAASVMGKTSACPLCCSPSDAVHVVDDDGHACARCRAAPRTYAVAPCFHMQFCDECAPRASHDRCSTCAGAVSRTHRVFR